MKTFFQYELIEIDEVAQKIWTFVEGYRLFLFEGDLGSGKTTLIKALLRYKSVNEAQMASPSFAIIHEYRNNNNEVFYHIDLYRVQSIEELQERGVWECLWSDAMVFIEWPQLLLPYLSFPYVHFKLEICGKTCRKVYGERYAHSSVL